MKSSLVSSLRQLVLTLLLAAIPLFAAGGAVVLASEQKAVDPHAAPQTVLAHPEATAHDAATAGHGAGEHGSALSAAKLKDFFWRTVNFIALLIILVKFLGRPVMNALGSRQERIAGELADLNRRRGEAEAAHTAFTAKLAGMEKEMERVIEQAVTQAQIEKERILAEAERAAEDIRRQAQAAVRGEMEEARRRLREEVAEEAAKMAEELIKKNLTAADQTAITEQYLERVGAAL